MEVGNAAPGETGEGGFKPQVIGQVGSVAPDERPRRRGRKSKSELNAKDAPEGATGPGADAPKQRRKRKSKPVDPERVAKLAKRLEGIHILAAQVGQGMLGLNGENIKLSQLECSMLAEGLEAVAQEYELDIVNSKAAATFQLLSALGMVYGPRLYAIKADIEAKRRNGPITVDA